MFSLYINLITFDVQNDLTKQEKNLLVQDNKVFVLQWMGLSKIATAREYQKTHSLNDKMKIYRRGKAGRILYLVFSDQFLTHALADIAIKEYKKRGYQGKPWVKSMTSVQAEIKAFEASLSN